ncbi:MAG: hypothetical protein JEZ10_04060 [Verrucomicrobia bacterium]|nr:hypothetical protein [Verrucomicrobiota bacterium]
MAENAKRILILGLGGAGCSTIARIASTAPDGMEFAVMDCDVQTLERCAHIETRLVIGKGITDGLSAGGDLETGRRCAESSVSQIETLLSAVDLLLVVTGLGGGLGSGAAPVLARMARNAGAHSLFFTVLPFPFEGSVVQGKAHNSLHRLRTHADAIVQMPNKRIQPDGDALLTDSMERSDRTLSAGVVGLWRILSHTGLCNLDFADLHTLLRYCDATCRFSCASATGEGRAQTLIDALRVHPLADNGAIFENAPGMLVGITGGEDLTLAEAQQIMESIVPDNETCWVKMGIAIDPSFSGRISAMVLTAESWKEPLVGDGRGGLKSASGEGGQGELPGVLKPRSRAFGGSERTVWRGEDLDVPTYLRRKTKLPR